jgi:two-component system, chemotaxis family, sensor kinase CheA
MTMLATRQSVPPPAPVVRDGKPRFPGVTLELDAVGQITGAWLGAAAPVLAASSDALEALDVDPASPDAALVQLLLAAAIGAPGEAWPVLAGDAPAMLHRRDGRLLAVTWDAVIDGGAIAGVALFALAIEAPRSELDDPIETNRICNDALTQLDECETCVLHLKLDPRARASVHRLFRAMHTIKGSMRGTQLRAVRDLAHEIEAEIESLREFDDAPDHLVAEIARSLQQLRTAIAGARQVGELDDAMTDLMRECRPSVVDLQLTTVRLAVGDQSAAVVATRAIERIRMASERASMRSLRGQCAAAARAVDAIAHGATDDQLVEDIAMLDRQLELYMSVYRETTALDAGPSLLTAISAQVSTTDHAAMRDAATALIAQVNIPSLAEALDGSDPLATRCAIALLIDAPAMFAPCHPRDETTQRIERAQLELSDALDGLAEQVSASELAPLRAAVERLSHVPLTPLAQRLAHMVRSLAGELGKSCEAKIDLGELVVLPATSRVVGEILLHAVRNALDHGIEAPADRVAAGKDAKGAIEIAAYSLGDRLVVTVRDDGRGVDVDRVRRRAVERGLLSAAEAEVARPAQLLDLLFHPGFSTAAAVTLVSGRGIGMDVIRSLAEEHGGSVAIASNPGRGAELTIELPLSQTTR